MIITCDNDVDGINFSAGRATNEGIGILVFDVVNADAVMPIPVVIIHYPTFIKDAENNALSMNTENPTASMYFQEVVMNTLEIVTNFK